MKKLISVLLVLCLCLSVGLSLAATPSKPDPTKPVVIPTPTPKPTAKPTAKPTTVPTTAPTTEPTVEPTEVPAIVITDEELPEEMKEAANEEKAKLESTTAPEYFAPEDPEAFHEEVTAILGTEDYKVYEFKPFVVTGVEEGCGDTIMQFTFDTPFQTGEAVVFMLGFYQADDTIEWKTLLGEVADTGAVDVLFPEEDLLRVQNESALMAIISKNLEDTNGAEFQRAEDIPEGDFAELLKKTNEQLDNLETTNITDFFKPGEEKAFGDQLTELLGTSDWKVYEFEPLTASGVEEGSGSTTRWITFETLYPAGEKLALMMGFPQEDGTITWEMTPAVAAQDGVVEVTISEEDALRIQENGALMAIISGNLENE